MLAQYAVKLFDNGQWFTPRNIGIMHNYFSKFHTQNNLLYHKLMTLLNQQINQFMEISTDVMIYANVHHMLTLAANSSQYLSRIYNEKFESIFMQPTKEAAH